MDNIRYGKLDASDEDVIAAAKLANADSFIRHLPQAYIQLIQVMAATLAKAKDNF